MPVKSPAHVTVALPPGVRPSDEMSEVLIRKFLKACKKEDLQRNVLDKSADVRRFERPAQVERVRRKAAKERAIREAKMAEGRVDANEKKKQSK